MMASDWLATELNALRSQSTPPNGKQRRRLNLLIEKKKVKGETKSSKLPSVSKL